MRRNVCAASLLAVSFTALSLFAQQPAPAEATPGAEQSAGAQTNAPAANPGVAPSEAQPGAHEAKAEAGEEPFGKAGVINLASDVALNIQHTGYAAPSGGSAPSSITTYMFGPAADYFVIDNLSVGALLQIGRESVEGSEVSMKKDIIGFEPRIGYHLSLVPEKFGLWPRVSFFYEQAKYKPAEQVENAATFTEKSMGIGFFVPFLIHPVEHFHIGIGPYLNTALSTKVEDHDAAKATTIGLRMEIAGWWKL